MAPSSMSRCFATLTLIIFFHSGFLKADSSSFFSFGSFDKYPVFDSSIAFYGDARAVNGESSVQLTGSVSSSAGRVIYKKPIKLVEGNPRKLASFSTNFSFSISKEKGDGLAFVMFPSGFNFSKFGNSSFGLSLDSDKSEFKVVAVEFDTLRDDGYRDLNDNHLGIDVGSLFSVKVRNVSSLNMLLNSGKKISSWIDYEASSKRLEVRLKESGKSKPVDPLLSYPIDLSKLWNDKEIYVGLTSSNEKNSSQMCYLHSWSFKLWNVPRWMHSQPLDPEFFAKNKRTAPPLKIPKPNSSSSSSSNNNNSSHCLLRVIAALVLGTASGALGASIVLYLWTVFANRRPIVPEEYAVHPVDFDYEKVKVVVVGKAVEDSKK